MKRIGVALALAVFVAGCAPALVIVVKPMSKNKGGPDTFVTLAMVNGVCKVTDGVGALGGKKSGKVVWHVNNGCATDQYLTITHYQERAADGTLGSIVTDVIDPDPLYSVKIKKGATDKKVDGTIVKENNGTDDKEYKYWICNGPSAQPPVTKDNCLDPDVDVWPI